MPLLRLLLTALLAALAVPALALAPPIGAGAVSDMLEAGDVAVDPDARITAGERAALERAARRLRAEGIPVDFAVIRAEGLGAAEFAEAVHRRLGYRGLQVVVVQEPRSIGFASERLFLSSPGARAAQERAQQRLATDPVGAATALARDVWRLGLEAEARREQQRREDDEEGSEARNALIASVILILVVGVGLGVRRLRRSRGGRRPVRPRVALEPMLDSLAGRITDLQPRADDPDAEERVRSAYADAVIAYSRASEELPAASTAAEAARVQETVERGLDAARRAEALLDGAPAAEPTPGRRRRRGRRARDRE